VISATRCSCCKQCSGC